MPHRTLEELEEFLARNGVVLEDRAFELELNSHGWRVANERANGRCIQLEIECLVECDEHLPRALKIVSDDGYNDRDIALMRALERVLDHGFARAHSTEA